MSLERKCQICGHVGATLVSPYSDMMRCGYCGMTDSGHMFKDVTPQPPVADEPFPDLAQKRTESFGGSVVIRLADVEKLANLFDCTVVKRAPK